MKETKWWKKEGFQKMLTEQSKMAKLYECYNRGDEDAIEEMQRKSVANKVLLEYSHNLSVGGVKPTSNYVTNMLQDYTDVLAYTNIFYRLVQGSESNGLITEMPTYIEKIDIFAQKLKGLGITKEKDIEHALISLIDAVSPVSFVKATETNVLLVGKDWVTYTKSIIKETKSKLAQNNPPEINN